MVKGILGNTSPVPAVFSGALACYIAGDGAVLNLNKGEDVDSVTPFKDFANDVVARAQWFADRGFTFNA